jgi:hypothetical protein
MNVCWRNNLQDSQSMSAKNILDKLTHTSVPVSLIAMFVVSDEFETLLPVRSTFEKSSDDLLHFNGYHMNRKNNRRALRQTL